jgi:hypothetical protein
MEPEDIKKIIIMILIALVGLYAIVKVVQLLFF